MGAGSKPIPTITLVLQNPEGEKSPMANAHLSVDNKPIKGVAESRKPTADKDDDVAYIVTSSENKSFLFALPNGHTIEMKTVDGLRHIISLNGVAAALLRIDDIQGRIGTQSALIRTGDKPASTVPEPLALPIIVAAKPPADVKADAELPQQLRNFLQKTKKYDDCDDIAEHQLNKGDSVDVLSRTQALVGIQCIMGAYQGSKAFWIVENGDVTKATPVLFQFPGTSKKETMLMEADFDPSTASLSFFGKGRGIGDCGESGTYVWTGQSFELSTFALMEQCRGVMYMPIIWQSQLK
jgi:hypothetical protein